MPVKQIEWSEELPPNKGCNYDHCIGKTPIGHFLITWKGWKDCPSYEAEHILFFNFESHRFRLNEAKEDCQKWFNETVTSCLTDN